MSLVESHQRKAVFLKEAMRDMENVTVIARRAEAIQAHFDWLVSRAVNWNELKGLSVAPKLALLGTAASGSHIPLPWNPNRHVTLVSR